MPADQLVVKAPWEWNWAPPPATVNQTRTDAKPGPYITQLTPAEETQFQSWVKQNQIPFDPSAQADYDMRGFWRGMLAGKVARSTENLHFPDTYKTPYHKTFSNESIYATADAPHWQGSQLVDKSGKIVADESPAATEKAPWERDWAQLTPDVHSTIVYGGEAPPPPEGPVPPGLDPRIPAPSVFERIRGTYSQDIGAPTFLDILALSNRYGTPEELKARSERGVKALQNLIHGLNYEPNRVLDEFSAINRSFFDNKQTTNDTFTHMLGAVPMIGPVLADTWKSAVAEDYPAFLGHLGALATFRFGGKAAEGTVEGAQAAGTMMQKAPAVVRASVRAAAPDVAVGAGKVALAAAAEHLPVPGPVKYALEIPTGYAGAKQIGRGLKKGFQAGRAAAAEATAPAAAEPVAPAAEVRPPVTGMTDDAVLQMYSIETDPVKRAALRQEIESRGLAGTPPAAAPNPYSNYTQDALRRAYQLETSPDKLTQIEDAAKANNYSLFNREARRATASPPETGFTEQRGPSLTQEDAAMLRRLGVDPQAATAEDIAAARQLAYEELDAATTPKPAAPPPPAAPSTPATPPGSPGEPPAAAAAATVEPDITPEFTLDDFAKGLAKKPFAKLSAKDQASVQAAYDRFQQSKSEPPPDTMSASEAQARFEAEKTPLPAEEQPTFEEAGREKKASLYADWLIRKQVPLTWLESATPDTWRLVQGELAKENPGATINLPSEQTAAAILDKVRAAQEGATAEPPPTGVRPPVEAAAPAAESAVPENVDRMLAAIPNVKYELVKNFSPMEWQVIEELADLPPQSAATRQALLDRLERRPAPKKPPASETGESAHRGAGTRKPARD